MTRPQALIGTVETETPGVPGRSVRLMFYAFIVSLIFESPERTMPIEIHTLTGSILLAVALLRPRHCWSSRPLAFWCFALFAWLYIVFGVRTDHVPEMVVNGLRLIQLVLLFLLASNLLRHESIARNSLIAFVLACTSLSLLQRLELISTWTVAGGVFRMSALGQNPNMLAHHMALGITAALGLAIASRTLAGSWHLVLSLVAIPVVALLTSTLVYTASRAGLLAAATGATVLALASATKGRGNPVRAVAVSIGAAALLTAGVYRVPAMATRLEAAIQAQDLTLREEILPASWTMFLEKPLVGWGPVNHMYELATRVPRRDLPYRETHNVALELLTETGIVGALPFLVAMAICILSAWRGRRGPLGALPFALALIVLGNRMSTAGIYTKAHWLALAFALAAGTASGDVRRSDAGDPARQLDAPAHSG
jgi:O-antigen ligase